MQAAPGFDKSTGLACDRRTVTLSHHSYVPGMANLVCNLNIGRIEGRHIGTEGERDEILLDFHHTIRLPGQKDKIGLK